jgi:cyclophilin family peptidyl-prolyl cis-trans isomerase
MKSRRSAWYAATTFALLSIVSLTACAEQAKSGKPTIDDKKLPQILLQTSKGDVVLELYEDEAPNTVANFVNLVEKGFYDGLIFHRVLDQFMAQGGCPQGRGTSGPGYKIKCECVRRDHRKHAKGVIAMAHAGRDTGGSQFYITFVKTAHLDGKHTVFGQVVKGMDVVDSFNRSDSGKKPEVIKKAVVLRKRSHAYKPKIIK